MGLKGRRGLALATALLMSAVLLVLGIAFLILVERDYRFAGVQEKGQEAFYLARAGLEYASTRSDLVLAGGATVKRFVPAVSSTHWFEVRRLSDGRVVSRGVVGSAVSIFAERTLEVAPGDPVRNFRDQSL